MSDSVVSPEQAAVREASLKIRELVEKPQFSRLLAAMVAFRRCYAVAYRELQEALEAEAKSGPLPHMTLDAFVGAAMFEGAKPFSEHVLMRGFAESVLPWMADVVDRHEKRDQEQIRLGACTAETHRRTQAVPIGFRFTPQNPDACLSRDRSLVLTGWKPALLWLADLAMNAALLAKPPNRVLHFGEKSVRRPGTLSETVIVDWKAWAGCCNNGQSLARLFEAPNPAVDVPGPFDLLICSDLPAAMTGSYLGRPAAAVAGDANHRFSRWCSRNGAAFLGLVPFEDRKAPDIRTSEWEQLRTFADLRAVHVLEHDERHPHVPPDHYRIVVGTFAAEFDVPKTNVQG